MDSVEDALRLCEERQDGFYLTAFLLECWLGQITCHVVAEYSEKKQAKDRRLQKRRARQLFWDIFGHIPDDEIHHLLGHLSRFAEHNDPQSEIVFKCYAMLGADMPFDEWPKPTGLSRSEFFQRGVQQMRSCMDRLCDWVEAQVHRDTHVHTWLSPVSFHPDPDTREIASVGVQQRHFPQLDAAAQRRWRSHFDHLAAEHRNSPKWKMMGIAMASEETKEPHHPKVDQLTILLWPLVTRHNWTYRELMEVICELLPDQRGYPCSREQDLAAYCPNVLGLRKGASQRPPRRKDIPGIEVARKLYGTRPS